jgi:dATP pyrophosphohydrolase
MTELAVRVIDVYPYRRTGRGVELLLLRRAAGRQYEGSWRMVGGKIGPGEAAWEAARRELREETGFVPVQLWSIPSVNFFYEWREDRVNVVPAFAAEVEGDPVLDHEHDAFEWLAPEDAETRLSWPEQVRLAGLIPDIVARGVPSDLIVAPD